MDSVRTGLGTQVSGLPAQGFLHDTSLTFAAVPALAVPLGWSLCAGAEAQSPEQPNQTRRLSPGKGRPARPSRDGTGPSSPSEANLLSHSASA